MLDTTCATARQVVDDGVSVTDRQIAIAVTLLAERANIVAESAGAAPLAAAISDTTSLDLENQNVVVVISGGNTNLTDHSELTRTGLYELGRYVEARLLVANWPRAIADIVETISSAGAQLDVLERARQRSSDKPNRTPMTIGLEGSGPKHLNSVLDELSGLKGVSISECSFDRH